jgi:hypothetical protein
MASLNFRTRAKKTSGNSDAELTVLIERICALETDLHKIVDIIERKGHFSSSDFAKIIIKRRLYVEDTDRTNSGIKSVLVYD